MNRCFRLGVTVLLLLLLLAPRFARAQGLLLPFVEGVFFANDGTPLASGFICATVSGTTTNLATYSTYAGAIAGLNQNPNPVPLDTQGRASIFLGSGSYTIVILNPVGTGSSSCNGTPTGSAIKTINGVVGNILSPFTGSGTANTLTKFTGTQTLGNASVMESGGILNVNENLSVTGTTQFNSLTYTWPSSQSAGSFLQTNGSGTLVWTSAGSSTTGGWSQSGTTVYATNTTSNVVVGSITVPTSFAPGTGSIITYSTSGGTSPVIAQCTASGGPGTYCFEQTIDTTSIKLNSKVYNIGSARPIDIQVSGSALGRIQTDGTFSWGTTTDSAFLADINGSIRGQTTLTISGSAVIGSTLSPAVSLYVVNAAADVAKFENTASNASNLLIADTGGVSGSIRGVAGAAFSFCYATACQSGVTDYPDHVEIFGTATLTQKLWSTNTTVSQYFYYSTSTLAAIIAANASEIDFCSSSCDTGLTIQGGYSGLFANNGTGGRFAWLGGRAGDPGATGSATTWYIYVDTSDSNKLKARSNGGTVTTLAVQ